MSIKIYVHFEERGYPEKTSKLAVPKSWSSRPVSDVIQLFTKAYNDKNVENTIDAAEFHLETPDKDKIYSSDTVEAVLGDRSDYHLKPGAHTKAVLAAATVATGALRCKNYGCNVFFDEDQNHDGACHHHTGPPIFHDTMKCWSCCKERKAFDFESFQQIKGCATGKHSTVSPAVAISASPNYVDPASIASAPAAPALKSIAAYNAANPDAATAAASAGKTIASRKSSRNENGTARCQRKGCQQTFNVADNCPTACTYHRGHAIFHDAAKFWSCCPDKKRYEFEAFLAVQGCVVGFHDDGVLELDDVDLQGTSERSQPSEKADS